MKNMGIRLEARRQTVPLRLLADELGISSPTLYRRLNTRMTKEERQRYLSAIRTIAERQSQGGN